MIAFPYYGGKYCLRKWLSSYLPLTKTYCEPFGGSGAILINRTPSKVEVLNDADGEIANFFRVLREKPKELIYLLEHTLYSRREFALACEPTDDLVERARRLYVRMRQGRSGIPTARGRQWKFSVTYSRMGMAASVSQWIKAIEGLPEIVERIRRVQFLDDTAEFILRRFDGKDVLFYCDPPYPKSSRNAFGQYRHEMTEQEHLDLAKLLHSLKAKVAISGYHCQLYDDAYKDWRFVEYTKNNHTSKNSRTEVLWMNY